MADRRERLFLIDGANLAYRSYFAFVQAPLTNSRGLNTSAAFGFTQTILKLLEEEKPDYLSIIWDPSGPTARHARYPEYKATRQKMPEEMSDSLDFIDRIVAGFGFSQIQMDGWEADDVIGTLAVKAADAGLDVYIVSSDKDFLQIARPNLRLYNLRKGWSELEIVGPAETLQKWGVGPEGIRDVLALMGDSSDNIPGVPGIGEKTAAALVREHGPLERILEAGEAIKGPKLREAIAANRAQALLSKELVTLDTAAPVALELEKMRIPDPDSATLTPLFIELEFTQFVTRVGRKRKREAPVDYRTVKTDPDLDDLLARLGAAEAFAFDTETTGLNPFDADVIGLSFSFEEGKAFYVPTFTPGVPGTLFSKPHVDEDWLRRLLARLKPLLEDPARAKGGQNSKYDILVLGRYGIDVRGLAFDTMIASYLCDPSLRQHNLDVLALRYLNEKKTPTEELIGRSGKNQLSMFDIPLEDVARYACEDADYTWRLHQAFVPRLKALEVERLYREVELPLVLVLARMERAGVKLDAPLLKRLSVEYDQKLDALAREIHAAAGEVFNIDSPKQLATILFEKLEVHKSLGVRVKKLKTGYSTDQSVLEGLTGHPVVSKIMDYRQLRKLKGTYLDALPALVAKKTGLLHTSFNQAVAATGRLSSSDPNLQNIPIRTDEGRRIRAAFVPRADGRILLSADYSQVELRVLAHVTRDPTLVETFRRGEDVHRATAARVFGVAPADVGTELRSRAKVINFGIIYGMGAQRLARETGLSLEEAQQFIRQYFEKFPGIKDYIDSSVRHCERHGFVQTLFGRRRLIPEIASPNAQLRAGARNMAVNTPIQGTAADLIKVAMVRIDDAIRSRGLGALMILQVHDELVFDVPERELDEVKALVKERMETAFSAAGAGEFAVPLKVDMGAGKTWLGAHG